MVNHGKICFSLSVQLERYGTCSSALPIRTQIGIFGQPIASSTPVKCSRAETILFVEQNGLLRIFVFFFISFSFSIFFIFLFFVYRHTDTGRLSSRTIFNITYSICILNHNANKTNRKISDIKPCVPMTITYIHIHMQVKLK